METRKVSKDDLVVNLSSSDDHSPVPGQKGNLVVIHRIARAAGLDGELSLTFQGRERGGRGTNKGTQNAKVCKPATEDSSVSVKVQSGGAETRGHYKVLPPDELEIEELYRKLQEGLRFIQGKALEDEVDQDEEDSVDYDDDTLLQLAEQAADELDESTLINLLGYDWKEEKVVCKVGDRSEALKMLVGEYALDSTNEDRVYFSPRFVPFIEELHSLCPELLDEVYERAEYSDQEEVSSSEEEVEEGTAEDIDDFPGFFGPRRMKAFRAIYAQIGSEEHFRARDIDVSEVPGYEDKSPINSILYEASNKSKALKAESYEGERINHYRFVDEYLPEEFEEARRNFRLEKFEPKTVEFELKAPSEFVNLEEILEEVDEVEQTMAELNTYIDLLCDRESELKQKRSQVKQLLNQAEQVDPNLFEELVAERVDE